MAIYTKKIGVWNDTQTMCDLFQTSVSIQKVCLFVFLETYMRMQDHACMCTHYGCAHRLILACACQGLLWPYFSKKIYLLIKKLYFSFQHFSTSLESRGSSRKRYKMWCL